MLQHYIYILLLCVPSAVMSACDANSCASCNGMSCNSCLPGFYLESQSCHRCSDITQHCKYCTNINGIFECYSCNPGFFPVANGAGGQCILCHINHCIECVRNTLCTTCETGYYGSRCQFQCSFCSDSTCLSQNCISGCATGSYTAILNNNTGCLACKEGCSHCTDIFSCTECGDRYFYAGGVCSKCQSNCKSCADGVSCRTCITGTWGNDCEHSCSGCIDNVCSKQSGTCNSDCIDGYIKDDYGHCTNITSTVQTCPDMNCSTGMYCVNKNCVECPSGCNSNGCSQLNGSCAACLEGHWGTQCDNKCNNACISTNCNRDNGNCNGCNNEYYGKSCDERCNDNCFNPGNSSSICGTNGVCTYGCNSGFKGPQCGKSNKSEIADSTTQEKVSQPIGVIAGAAGGGAFVVIVVICVVVFICIRRRSSKPENETQTFPVQHINAENTEQGYIYAVPNKLKKTNTLEVHTAALPVVNSTDGPSLPLRLSHLDQETDIDTVHAEEEIDDEEPGNAVIVNENIDATGDTYYNVAGLKRSRINIDNLCDYVAKKAELDFYKEFQKFPIGLTRPFTESRKPENITHNRYRTIYPYDATRVVLHDGRSDYINASYIDGYNQPKAYIASLGPTKATMAKFTLFWRMVWQEKVEKIVMLTNLNEGEKMKCEQYWPDLGNTERYGEVIVTCDSDDIYADFCVKRFSVSKNGDTRVLYHLHFTAWPDRSVPDDVTCLIEFRQKVENIKTTLGGPLIVHCSAGVGRTGTYIGLDLLTKEGKAEGSVDIFGCVMGLRGQRISMVQTMEQYRYLHDAVVHALTLHSDAVSSATFHMADRNNLQQQFEKMSQMKEKHLNEEENAVKRNTKLKDKNRKGADIPGDMHRVVLHGRTEYINAVYINSYKTRNRFILAQTPLSGTVEDFLYMILQENVTCIVSMDEDNVKYKTVGVYLPAANQTLKKGSIQIKATMCESTSSYTLRKLTITNLKENTIQEKTVYHFQMNFWKQTENRPSDINAFVELVKNVERTANETDVTSSIIVHCLTGAERSALFCVVSILIEKIDVDNVTSVVNTVRQIRSRRPAAIPNLDQYIFCHQCVSTYLKSCNTYSNVI